MAEIALGVPGLIDVIIRWGTTIMQTIDHHAEHDDVMTEYAQFAEDIGYKGMSFFFLETVKRALQDQSLPNSIKKILKERIEKFHEKLSQAITELRVVEKVFVEDRARYILHGRATLQNSMRGLKNQVELLHQFGVQLCVYSKGLHSSILTPENFVLIHETSQNHPGQYLPTSDILTARGNFNLGSGKSTGLFVVEGKQDGERNLRSLCETLRNAGPTEGILDCLGFRKPPYGTGLSSFELVFKAPSDQPLMSLAHLLAHERPPDFNSRLQICKKLTKAVGYLHELPFVHKNIRPRSILLAGSLSSIDTSLALYLLKWTSAREFSSVSAQLGEHLWQQALYQHPDRQSKYAMEWFEPYHDIYSLGVCLLEILLWKPFTVGSPPSKITSYGFPNRDEEIIQHLTSPDWVLTLFENSLVEQGMEVSALYDDICRTMAENQLSQNTWIGLANSELADLNHQAAKAVTSCLKLQFHQATDVLTRLDGVQSFSI